MADPVLHIKDSYYFEVPKALWPYDYKSARQFPKVWVSLDPEFQEWEFERLYRELTLLDARLPPKEVVREDWHHFVHGDHANVGKPADVFLEEMYLARRAKFEEWKAARLNEARAKKDGSVEQAQGLTFDDYVEHLRTSAAADSAEHESGAHHAAGHAAAPDTAYLDFFAWLHSRPTGWGQSMPGVFQEAREKAGGKDAIDEWQKLVGQDERVPDWSEEKIAAYNEHLSGKILIPQPFATLRNLYEKESGFAISKYMVIQLVIGLILVLVFANLAKRVRAGGPPRGYLWNLLEAFLLFIRNDIVAPSIGGHHEEHPEHEEKHGHEHGDPYGEHGKAHGAHGEPAPGHVAHDSHVGGHAHAHAHGHDHGPSEVSRLVPLFWTMFFFVLGCNLFGMLPWLGAPTASFSVTTGLALVTFLVGLTLGISKFGFLGYFANQIPSMALPIYMAVIIKPIVFLIEIVGMLIKHLVLAIRLLANMVAGHLVILGIMGIAFGATAAATFTSPDTPGWTWPVAATISVVASAAFSLLELFVAFLQAYIFTFLSALFIGAAIHKH